MRSLHPGVAYAILNAPIPFRLSLREAKVMCAFDSHGTKRGSAVGAKHRLLNARQDSIGDRAIGKALNLLADQPSQGRAASERAELGQGGPELAQDGRRSGRVLEHPPVADPVESDRLGVGP